MLETTIEELNSQVEPNSLEDFTNRFYALMSEAYSYGISSVVCIEESNMLSDETEFSAHYVGGKSLAIGMLSRAKSDLLHNRECE